MRSSPCNAPAVAPGTRCCARRAAPWLAAPRTWPRLTVGEAPFPWWPWGTTTGRYAELFSLPSILRGRTSLVFSTRPGPASAPRWAGFWAWRGRPPPLWVSRRGGRRRPGARWTCGWCPRPRRGRGACGAGRWRCRWRALLPGRWRQVRGRVCAFEWWTRCGCGSVRPPSRVRLGRSARWGAWGRCVRSWSRVLECVLSRWMTW